MSNIESQSAQVVLMTPQEAADILVTRAYARQRRIRANWVAELAEIIIKNQWVTTAISYAVCAETEKTYLVDGYHRLSSIVRAGEPATVLVNFLPCKTFADVGVLYSRLDRGIPRSITDGIVARDMSRTSDIPVNDLRTGIAAVNALQSNFTNDLKLNRKRGCDEKFKDLEAWYPELRAFVEATAGGPRGIVRKLHCSSIMSVAFVLFRHQPDKAHSFFRGIATNDGLLPDSAQHTFLMKVIDSGIGVRNVGVATMCRFMATCWNAYWENRPMKNLRSADISKPIVLLGTPYTRRVSESRHSQE